MSGILSRVPGSTSKPRVVLTCVLLTLITWAVYWPVLRCQFTNYDDDVYVTANAHVQSGLTLDAIRPGADVEKIRRKLASADLDVAHAGLSVVWTEPRRPSCDKPVAAYRERGFVVLRVVADDGAFGRSAFVAALFAWHPLHVESVAWVANGRMCSARSFGCSPCGRIPIYDWRLAIYEERCQVRGRGGGANGKGVSSTLHTPRSYVFYELALGAFALGLMSKPMVVTLPFVLLLLDFWPLGISEFRSAGHWAGGEG